MLARHLRTLSPTSSDEKQIRTDIQRIDIQRITTSNAKKRSGVSKSSVSWGHHRTKRDRQTDTEADRRRQTHRDRYTEKGAYRHSCRRTPTVLQVMNVEREGNSSVVTLDFFLEQDGELVAMETALQNLQSLTMEEMTALLEAPVSEDRIPHSLVLLLSLIHI